MNKDHTEWVVIEDKNIRINARLRVNKHIPDYYVVYVTDNDGHQMKFHSINAPDGKQACAVAESFYRRSPFPKKNLLESLMEYHAEKRGEEGEEDTPVEMGNVTFSVAIREEKLEEPQEPKKPTIQERFERAKRAKELYYQPGATYRSVGEQIGVGPERTRQIIAFYFRSVRAREYAQAQAAKFQNG